MKSILSLIILLLITVTDIKAQKYSKGDVTFTNETSVEGSIRIDYALNKVFVKNNFKVEEYDFARIVRVTLSGRTLDKMVTNQSIFYAAPIVKGRASLYQIEKSQYFIVKEDGVSKTIDIEKEQNTAPGILAVLFNDCNSIRRYLNNVDEYNGANLQTAIEAYNTCDYQPFSPTDNEAKNAANYNTDIANFYVGIGGGLSGISFFNSDDSESISSFQGQLGVAATPSFFGSLQGNLFVTLEAQAALGSPNNFSNVSRDVSFRLHSYRLLLGLEQLFSKNNNFSPYIGIAAGLTGDYYKGSVDGNDFNISGGNLIVLPKLGFKYLLPNEKQIALAISYITDYENDLTFPTEEEIIPLVVGVQTITIGINYHF